MGATETLQAVYDKALVDKAIFDCTTVLQRAYTAVVQGNMAIQSLTAKDVLKEYDPTLAEAMATVSAALSACQASLQDSKSLGMLTWTPTVEAAVVEEG